MALTSEELVIFRVSTPSGSKDPKVALIPKKRVVVTKIEGLGVTSGDPEVLVIFASRKKPIILKSPKYALVHKLI